jgi:hypothetical protein
MSGSGELIDLGTGTGRSAAAVAVSSEHAARMAPCMGVNAWREAHASRNILLHSVLRPKPIDGSALSRALPRRQMLEIGQVTATGKRSGLSRFCQKMLRKTSDRGVPLCLQRRWRVFTVPVLYWSLEEGYTCQGKAIRDPGDNPLVPP